MSLCYSGAKALMATARDPGRGKPLANNTRLFFDGEDYHVQLHSTRIVSVHDNGTWTLRHGGWTTITTAGRILDFSPANYTTWSSEGDGSGGSDWYVWLHERESDPRPPCPDRTIAKPFHVTDPGPEPTRPENGCEVGHKRVWTARERVLASSNELKSGDRPGTEPQWAPTRARSVLDYLGANLTRYSSHWVSRLVTHGEFSGESAYSYHDERWSEFIGGAPRYSAPSSKGIFKYVQCPHCKAFDAEHARWTARMNGAPYGRGERANRGYRQMCKWLEMFGTHEAWQEAYITEFREVREARKTYKAWVDRNRVRWAGEIQIDADGRLTKKCSDRLRRDKLADEKAARAQARVARRRQREHEARERERRQLERFKTKVRKRHGQPVREIAAEAVHALTNLRVALEIGATDERQSGETDGGR